MAYRTQCPRCRRTLVIPSQYLGQRVMCPCGEHQTAGLVTTTLAPAPSATAAPEGPDIRPRWNRTWLPALIAAAVLIVLVAVLAGGRSYPEIPRDVQEYARQVVTGQVPDSRWEIVYWKVDREDGGDGGDYLLKVRTLTPPARLYAFLFHRSRAGKISWQPWED